MKDITEIERSLNKKFRKTVWNPFVGAIKEYKLISPGDRIAVCVSGGKDSMLMAKCFQELSRHSEIPFEAVYLSMNPGYNEENSELLKNNARVTGVELQYFDTPIFDVVNTAGGTPCYLCARMRRGYLYNKAKELGCNKIALGHHMDDVIETLLLSMMYASEIKTMMPKLKSSNFEGMELIRPMYKVKENDIIHWASYNELTFLRCACRFTEQTEAGQKESKRLEIKKLICTLRQTNPEIADNIFRSLHNVNLNSVPGWRQRDGEDSVSFLEKY